MGVNTIKRLQREVNSRNLTKSAHINPKPKAEKKQKSELVSSFQGHRSPFWSGCSSMMRTCGTIAGLNPKAG